MGSIYKRKGLGSSILYISVVFDVISISALQQPVKQLFMRVIEDFGNKELRKRDRGVILIGSLWQTTKI